MGMLLWKALGEAELRVEKYGKRIHDTVRVETPEVGWGRVGRIDTAVWVRRNGGKNH